MRTKRRQKPTKNNGKIRFGQILTFQAYTKVYTGLHWGHSCCRPQSCVIVVFQLDTLCVDIMEKLRWFGQDTHAFQRRIEHRCLQTLHLPSSGPPICAARFPRCSRRNSQHFSPLHFSAPLDPIILRVLPSRAPLILQVLEFCLGHSQSSSSFNLLTSCLLYRLSMADHLLLDFPVQHPPDQRCHHACLFISLSLHSALHQRPVDSNLSSADQGAGAVLEKLLQAQRVCPALSHPLG